MAMGGILQGAQFSPTGELIVVPGDQVSDAFQRQRVSIPFNLLDNSLVFNAAPQIMDTALTGGGTFTYLTGESAGRLRVGLANGDRVIRQSFARPPYQPGRSYLILMTGIMGAIKAGVAQRIGAFDADNGLFFEQNGTTLRVVVRRAGVDVAVDQANWNLDKMDGTGPSGVTINMAAAQVFVIDFQWLGVGRVRYGFSIAGKTVYCHEVLNANVSTVGVYMVTSSNPVRYEIQNLDVSPSNTDLIEICASIVSEGGQEPLGLLGSCSSFLANTTGLNLVALTRTPVATIRLKSGFEKAAFRLLALDALNESADFIFVEVFAGGVLSGGAAVVTAVSEALEMVTGNTTLTGGDRLYSTHLSSQLREATDSLLSTAFFGSTIAGVPQIVTVTMTAMNGASTGAHAGLTWREYP